MWIKVLTILNTVVLLAALIVGILEYSGTEVFPRSEVELPEDFVEEYTEIKDYFDDLMKDKNAELEDEVLSNTLDIVDRQAKGYVDLRGYLVTETTSQYPGSERAYFAFSQASDDTIMEFIDGLVDSGNTINRISSGTYYLGIGCNASDGIYGALSITGDNYEKLRTSSSSAQVSTRVFFGDLLDGEGPCASFATGLQLID